jgi:hypothetical protein
VRPGAPQRCSRSFGLEYYSCMMTSLAADLCEKSTGERSHTGSFSGTDTVSGSYRCAQWPLSNRPDCPKDCVVSGWSAAPVPCTPGTTYTSSPTISQQPAFGGAACPGTKTEQCPVTQCGNGILETGEQCDTGNGGSAGCQPGCKCVDCKLECGGGGCKTLARVKCDPADPVTGAVKCYRITAWGPNATYTDPVSGAVTTCAEENCCPHGGTDTTTATRGFGVGVCLSLKSACPSNPGRPTDPNSFRYSHSPDITWAKCLSPEDSCMPGLEPACGNNVLEDNEACDGSVPSGACPTGKTCSCNSCKVEWCGDGVVNNGEACDGGATCSAECTVTSGGGGGGGSTSCACSYNLSVNITPVPDGGKAACAAMCQSIGATSALAEVYAGYCVCGGVPYATCPSSANGNALNTMAKSSNTQCYPSDPCPIDSKGCINYCASRGGRGDPTCKSTWIGPVCTIKCVSPASRLDCPNPPSDVGFCDEKCNCLENGA